MKLHGNRARLGVVLAAIVATTALVALPGIASARHGNDASASTGTIQSFDTESGVLTIALTEGGSVSGLVTPRTHIHCDNGRHRGQDELNHGRRHLRSGATASNQSRGRGGNNGKGEDNQANGDDPPGHDGTAPGRSEGPGRGDENGASCGVSDLTEGKAVKFAELLLVDGKAVFKIIALPATEKESQEETGAQPSA